MFLDDFRWNDHITLASGFCDQCKPMSPKIAKVRIRAWRMYAVMSCQNSKTITMSNKNPAPKYLWDCRFFVVIIAQTNGIIGKLITRILHEGYWNFGIFN